MRIVGLLVRVCVLACLAAASGSQATADDYPARPVRILVPFAPGGGTDLITRALADIIATEWKSSVVIENRPGGGTTIATLAALSAPADGYTLVAASNSFIVSPMIMPQPPYQWDRDFVAVSLFAVSPHILVVNPKLPVHTLDEFVAWAKAQGGEYLCVVRQRIVEPSRLRGAETEARHRDHPYPLQGQRAGHDRPGGRPCRRHARRSSERRRTARGVRCERLRSPTKPDCRRCPTCRRSMSLASTDSPPNRGSEPSPARRRRRTS